MSNSEKEEIAALTASMDHALDMGEAWLRLQRNHDFKKIITEGFLKEKVLASVSLLAVPQIMSEGRRPAIMEDIVAASNLQFFFQMIEHQYDGAKNPILSDSEEAEFAALQEEAEKGVN
jgi:hypothetical protein